MQFELDTVEEIDEKSGSHLLALMSKVLIDHGFHINYMEFNEIAIVRPIGDNSIEEEYFFQSKVTRKPAQKKKKDCTKEVCAIEE